MQINIGDHVSPQAGYAAIPNEYLGSMSGAISKARWIASNIQSANAFFRTLPDGRSLTDLLDDSSIWINYHANCRTTARPTVSGQGDRHFTHGVSHRPLDGAGDFVHELAALMAHLAAPTSRPSGRCWPQTGQAVGVDTGIDDPYILRTFPGEQHETAWHRRFAVRHISAAGTDSSRLGLSPSAEPSAATAYQRADVVRHCSAVQGDINQDGDRSACACCGAWKRPVGAEIEVRTATTCAFDFQSGTSYLLYLTVSADGAQYSTKRCMGNQPLPGRARL